jgi:hypothetical protein
VRISNNMARFIMPLVAVALLAGCSGGGGSPALQSSGNAAGTQSRTASIPGAATQSIAAQGVDSDMQPDATCKSSGLKVSPCPISLTVSDPVQAVTLTLKTGDTITEKDNCAKSGAATVAGSGANYTVTAGLTTGGCVAKFTEKNGKMLIGRASLPIKNKV